MEGKNMWENTIPKGPENKQVSPQEVPNVNEQRHPEQRDGEVFIGNFETLDEEDGENYRTIEEQEDDNRTRFEDIVYKTKRRGAVVDGLYPVFVKKSELEK